MQKKSKTKAIALTDEYILTDIEKFQLADEKKNPIPFSQKLA